MSRNVATLLKHAERFHLNPRHDEILMLDLNDMRSLVRHHGKLQDIGSILEIDLSQGQHQMIKDDDEPFLLEYEVMNPDNLEEDLETWCTEIDGGLKSFHDDTYVGMFRGVTIDNEIRQLSDDTILEAYQMSYDTDYPEHAFKGYLDRSLRGKHPLTKKSFGTDTRITGAAIKARSLHELFDNHPRHIEMMLEIHLRHVLKDELGLDNVKYRFFSPNQLYRNGAYEVIRDDWRAPLHHRLRSIPHQKAYRYDDIQSWLPPAIITDVVEPILYGARHIGFAYVTETYQPYGELPVNFSNMPGLADQITRFYLEMGSEHIEMDHRSERIVHGAILFNGWAEL